ncbi:MAG: acetylpolyamine amidohydrolase [Deltaproteobacteria bacterium HGW-Deltaproteobacteria-17]|nr:MAG: acetylpolyamine amidohydrolase [Deltaproteobacteria bacterium HGW-Deltaproteobacteria-17]
MFRIRYVSGSTVPANANAVAQVQAILREQFPLLRPEEVDQLPHNLQNPFKVGFRTLLLVAENGKSQVLGFAILYHEPDLHFCVLDFLSASRLRMGSGVGGALYQRVRQEALALSAYGIFMECLPDDAALSPQPEVRRQNASRLKFYEAFGARPIVGTRYETPVHPDDTDPPYLVFDDLGRNRPLRRKEARAAVRAILERKYGHMCSPEYIKMVVESYGDDPVRLREPKYVRTPVAGPLPAEVPPDRRILLLVNEAHDVHHVHDRGYVEAPVRIRTILKELRTCNFFQPGAVHHFGEKELLRVHDPGFIRYFKKVTETIGNTRSVYPYVFPIRNVARPPKELIVRAGYYCIDTFTPLNLNAWLAASGAVDCALTGAAALLEGRMMAYALVRPPGHHAERRSFGGFCYFNSGAIATDFLSSRGKVATLDIDYHHGNGQQDIFYERADVLTVSIHGHPSFAYPYFSGFEEEKGAGAGEGFCVNYPLPETITAVKYRETLERALARIRKFAPTFLVVHLGLDTAGGDPTGSWPLKAEDFRENGRLIGALGLPTLVIQEGGYNTRNLGVNARAFFRGLWAGNWQPGLPIKTYKKD